MRVAAALLTLYTVWGSTYLAIRWVVEAHWPLLATASVRFVLASVVFLALARLQGPLRGMSGGLRELGHAAVAGTLLFVVSNGLVMWGQTRLASGLAALLVAAVPVWITLIEAALGRRPTARQLGGVAAGMAGVLVLVGPSGGGVDPLGAAAVCLASVAWAFGTVWTKRVPAKSGPMESAGWQMGVAGIVLAAVSAWRGDVFPALEPRPLAAFAWLLVGGSILGFGAFSWLIRNTTPAVATTYAYVNPVVAAGLGWALADEPFGPRALFASALVLGGVVAITAPQRMPSPALADSR